MRVAIIGQQAFGKSVLEAFVARGDEVVGVFCAPEKEARGRIRCVWRRSNSA
jgi:Methionyl-tRNA formyltransferase